MRDTNISSIEQWNINTSNNIKMFIGYKYT